MAKRSNLRVNEFSLFVTLTRHQNRVRCETTVSMAPQAYFNSEWMGFVLLDGRGRVFRQVSKPPPGPLNQAGSSFGSSGFGVFEFRPTQANTKPHRLIVFFLGEVATYRVGLLKADEYQLKAE